MYQVEQSDSSPSTVPSGEGEVSFEVNLNLDMWSEEWSREKWQVLYTSPSALFFSSSFCLTYSSAILVSMISSDWRVNGRNRQRSSSDDKSEASDMSSRA